MSLGCKRGGKGVSGTGGGGRKNQTEGKKDGEGQRLADIREASVG